MEYTVIQASPLSSLIEKVNEKIKNGWELQGGICTASTDNSEFFQALVKK